MLILILLLIASVAFLIYKINLLDSNKTKSSITTEASRDKQNIKNHSMFAPPQTISPINNIKQAQMTIEALPKVIYINDESDKIKYKAILDDPSIKKNYKLSDEHIQVEKPSDSYIELLDYLTPKEAVVKLNHLKSIHTWIDPKVYAKLMCKIDGREWLSNDDFKKKMEEQTLKHEKEKEIHEYKTNLINTLVDYILKSELNYSIMNSHVTNSINEFIIKYTEKESITQGYTLRNFIFREVVSQMAFRANFSPLILKEAQSLRRRSQIKMTKGLIKDFPFEELYSIFNKQILI